MIVHNQAADCNVNISPFGPLQPFLSPEREDSLSTTLKIKFCYVLKSYQWSQIILLRIDWYWYPGFLEEIDDIL